MISSRAPILCGLIGAGIQGSRSPAMHGPEASEQGLHCVYKLIVLGSTGYPLLLVHPSVGVNSVGELVALAKTMPSQLSCGRLIAVRGR